MATLRSRRACRAVTVPRQRETHVNKVIARCCCLPAHHNVNRATRFKCCCRALPLRTANGIYHAIPSLRQHMKCASVRPQNRRLPSRNAPVTHTYSEGHCRPSYKKKIPTLAYEGHARPAQWFATSGHGQASGLANTTRHTRSVVGNSVTSRQAGHNKIKAQPNGVLKWWYASGHANKCYAMRVRNALLHAVTGGHVRYGGNSNQRLPNKLFIPPNRRPPLKLRDVSSFPTKTKNAQKAKGGVG